jgi:transposase
MEYGAIDLHAKESQIRIIDETGHVVWDRRITTRRESFVKVFGARPSMRILLESSTESEWVAQCLEACGHEVIVADPNYAPMYGHRARRIKTDKRDVAALAEANRLGIYRCAHRVSAAQQAIRGQLRVREQLIRVRTQSINLLRALLRQQGIKLPGGAAEGVVTRVAALSVPPTLQAILAPIVDLLTWLGPVLVQADSWVEERATADPIVTRLMTTPGVGPVTALTFRATLDRVERFAQPGQVSAYVGLVPREDSSAERQRKGHITKAGSPRLRALLVQAAWGVWRSRGPSGAPLRAWAQRLAGRRGRRVAIVALARRLSRILFALWRDGSTFAIRGANRASVAA